MNNAIKTSVSTLIFTALLSGAAYADQSKRKKGPNIEQIVSSLQLDASTATSLKTLMKSHREAKQASREKDMKNREQKQASRKQHRQALLEILGYEKMYKFDEMMREYRSKKGNKRGIRSKHNHDEK